MRAAAFVSLIASASTGARRVPGSTAGRARRQERLDPLAAAAAADAARVRVNAPSRNALASTAPRQLPPPAATPATPTRSPSEARRRSGCSCTRRAHSAENHAAASKVFNQPMADVYKPPSASYTAAMFPHEKFLAVRPETKKPAGRRRSSTPPRHLLRDHGRPGLIAMPEDQEPVYAKDRERGAGRDEGKDMYERAAQRYLGPASRRGARTPPSPKSTTSASDARRGAGKAKRRAPRALVRGIPPRTPSVNGTNVVWHCAATSLLGEQMRHRGDGEFGLSPAGFADFGDLFGFGEDADSGLPARVAAAPDGQGRQGDQGVHVQIFGDELRDDRGAKAREGQARLPSWRLRQAQVRTGVDAPHTRSLSYDR